MTLPAPLSTEGGRGKLAGLLLPSSTPRAGEGVGWGWAWGSLDFACCMPRASFSWICLLYAEWSQVVEVTLRRVCISPTLKQLPTKGTKGGPLGLGRQEPSPWGSEESPRECSVESPRVSKSIQIQVLDLHQDTSILETISSSNKPW